MQNCTEFDFFGGILAEVSGKIRSLAYDVTNIVEIMLLLMMMMMMMMLWLQYVTVYWMAP